MGLSRKKSIQCPQKQWTTLISNFGSGLPATWHIRLRAKDGGDVTGVYIEKRWLWIFPQPPVTGPLTGDMTFHRYWINAIYTLKISPATDVIVEID